LQISAIPSGPTYYQPVTAVPAIPAVKGQAADSDNASAKLRAAPPPGIGSLLDLEA
jgi:hypothetical protein